MREPLLAFSPRDCAQILGSIFGLIAITVLGGHLLANAVITYVGSY